MPSLICCPLDFVFSPDVKYVAAIAEDGCIRIIDAIAEQWVVLIHDHEYGSEGCPQAGRLLRVVFRSVDMCSLVAGRPIHPRARFGMLLHVPD